MKAQTPDGTVVDVLVTPQGELVTDMSDAPFEAVPSNFSALRVDSQGNTLVS